MTESCTPVGLASSLSRDVTDRITQVLLPDGEILDYAYDASGNLTAFVDQARTSLSTAIS